MGAYIYIKEKEKSIKKLNDVDISIDFPSEKLHDEFRGYTGAFRMAKQTLDICKDLGITSTVVTVAMSINFYPRYMEALLQIAREYNSYFRINIMRPIVPFHLKYIVPPKQYWDTLIWLLNNSKIVTISDVLISSIIREHKYHGDFVGKNSLRILPTGDITPSTYLITEEWRKVNIYKEDVDLSLLKFKIPSITPSSCKRCKFKNSCKGGTIDRRWLWYKSLEKRDPYCLFNLEKQDQDKIIKELGKISLKYERPSHILVHEDYLPTIILKPL